MTNAQAPRGKASADFTRVVLRQLVAIAAPPSLITSGGYAAGVAAGTVSFTGGIEEPRGDSEGPEQPEWTGADICLRAKSRNCSIKSADPANRRAHEAGQETVNGRRQSRWDRRQVAAW